MIPADGAIAKAEPINTDASLLKLGTFFGKLENYHLVNESKDAAGKVQVLEAMGDTGIPADSFLPTVVIPVSRVLTRCTKICRRNSGSSYRVSVVSTLSKKVLLGLTDLAM